LKFVDIEPVLFQVFNSVSGVRFFEKYRRTLVPNSKNYNSNCGALSEAWPLCLCFAH